jgi:hypothetical protein
MQILLGILTTTISIHHSSKAALSITQTRLCNYIESLFVERARNYVYVMAWQWMTENNNHMTFFYLFAKYSNNNCGTLHNYYVHMELRACAHVRLVEMQLCLHMLPFVLWISSY